MICRVVNGRVVAEDGWGWLVPNSFGTLLVPPLGQHPAKLVEIRADGIERVVANSLRQSVEGAGWERDGKPIFVLDPTRFEEGSTIHLYRGDQ